ncbi:MAG TPA: long-chain fatty acid--CoA ligase [Spirochaetaceae bacterium]|nr:long-chain fatty acid--CoA ligase [Spirochaetaceae bacterium]
MVELALAEEFDKHRGKLFSGDYPTLSVSFHIVSGLYPDNICFREFFPEDSFYSYSQADSLIKRIALKLKRIGVTKGDRVAVCGKNSCVWGLVFYAINAASAVAVPIDALLSKDEVCNIAGKAKIKFAFADGDRCPFFPFLEEGMLVRLDKVAAGNQQNRLPEEADSAFGSALPYLLDWLSDQDDSGDLALPSDDRDLACILFTSGTTGVPKGVQLTNRNIMADVAMTEDRFRVYSHDSCYAILPLHHAYALMAALLVLTTVGGEVIFGKRLVSQQIFREMRKGKPTIFLGVPLLYTKIANGIRDELKRRGPLVLTLAGLAYRLSHFFRFSLNINIGRFLFGKILRTISFDSVRSCICGGGPLSEKVVSNFLVWGVNFMQGYGMTETSPIIALNPLESRNCKSVGKILTGISAEIRNKGKDGNGTLFVKGENCMKGYYEDPEETSEILGDDGFIDTGDVGHLDSRGYFYITGRAKNIIVTSGGKNVFPEEIEEKFSRSRKVAQIVIVGFKSDEEQLDERIRAVAYPTKELLDSVGGDFSKAKKAISKEIASVNRSLRSYKKIEDLKVVKEPFEMTTTRKIKRSCIERLLENAI